MGYVCIVESVTFVMNIPVNDGEVSIHYSGSAEIKNSYESLMSLENIYIAINSSFLLVPNLPTITCHNKQ